MCISAQNMCSPLNPSAQEWSPPPPYAAAQMVSPPLLPPPHKLAHPLYFHGFIPCGAPCMLPPPPTYYSPPEAVVFYGAAPPPKVERPALQSRKRNIAAPRMWRLCGEKSVPPRRRLEWRPRKYLGGGGATPSPPRGSALPVVKMSMTTVMIKNLPNQLRRDFMLEFLDGYCKSHSLEYDFFYLPMDFSKENNLGYAFVNLTSMEAAIKFRGLLQNYEWGTVTTEMGTYLSKKICEVKWATTQGKEGQLQRFQNSIFACDKLEFLPVVFDPPRNGSNGDVARPVPVGAVQKSV
ncbi:hypothetical protein ACS0TY_036050 [Phlomoides rotata]